MRMVMKNLGRGWLSLEIWKKVLVALVLGILSGICCGNNLGRVLKPFGDLFLSALHMVIVPVIFSSVVCAIFSVHDFRKTKRMTLKAMVLYLSFLFIGTVIAIVVGTLMAPGVGLKLSLSAPALDPIRAAPGVMDILVSMIPANPLLALVNENILQIVIFAILLGASIQLSGEKGKPLAEFFYSMAHVSSHLIGLVMRSAPYGVFALITWTFGAFGLAALFPLLKFILALFLASSIQVLLVYGGVILLYMRRSPMPFFEGVFPAIVFAITTTSSAATLPVTMRCAEESLKIPVPIARFLLPLGCNFNLSGLSIYLTLAVIFTAHVYGITLGFNEYGLLISTVILTTMGAGGIPGSGIIVMGAVITAMGLPLGALPLIAGIDRINDMIQTVTNVVSDVAAAFLVAHSEKQL
jgi:Na+/H+-dicarboxylate symporter